jgi:hypothetical protein
MTEPHDNDESPSVGNWLGGLIIAGALATAWRLQKRLNLRRRGTPLPIESGREIPEKRESGVSEEISEKSELDSDALSQATVIVGSYDDAEAALQAARSLRLEWPYAFEVYSPNLNEAFFEAIDLPRSATRLWIAAGAIFGELGGWTATIMLSIYWPHRVAGMPIIAIPPFTIISFEMMVLFGVAGGVVGLLFHCGLPSLEPPPDYLRRFQQDRFGIVLDCDGAEQIVRGQQLLEKHGAKDIHYF